MFIFFIIYSVWNIFPFSIKTSRNTTLSSIIIHPLCSNVNWNYLWINRKKLLSLLEHTPERQPHHSKRQARRRGDTRAYQWSHHGIRHFHWEYAQHRANADGEGVLNAKLNKNVVPYRTFTTSVFDKGQQSFVQFLFSFH